MGKSHTEEKNLYKGLPAHMKGSKIVKESVNELYKMNFLLKQKKTNEFHVSLNPRMKEEIYRFLGIPPRIKL